jgi:phosphoglycolate phosphatase-like HAD superfamily hydrolase
MKTIFLDLDGTILDSRTRHIVVLENILKEYGIANHDISDFVKYKASGNRTVDYLTQVIGLHDNVAEVLAKLWGEKIEQEEYLKLDVLYADAIPFLNNIKQRGYKIIIISARKNKKYVIGKIKMSSINELVDDIVIVSPYNAIVEKYNVISGGKTEKSFIVGDTEVDYEAGKRADINTLMLNRGFRNKKYWDDRHIKSYCDLYKVMEILDAKF